MGKEKKGKVWKVARAGQEGKARKRAWSRRAKEREQEQGKEWEQEQVRTGEGEGSGVCWDDDGARRDSVQPWDRRRHPCVSVKIAGRLRAGRELEG